MSMPIFWGLSSVSAEHEVECPPRIGQKRKKNIFGFDGVLGGVVHGFSGHLGIFPRDALGTGTVSCV
jgi:hypothetical protein